VPKELLQDETSVLYDLTKTLSPNEKKLIYDTANAKKITDEFALRHKSNDKQILASNRHAYENKAIVYD
jgi:hypothetical protein